MMANRETGKHGRTSRLVARLACANRCAEYAILGAGLDTFAYRNPFAGEGLRVFEVDIPGTQAWKRDLLSRTRIAEPPSLAFVPVDFERQSLAGELAAAGFRDDMPAFFSWLGVTMYLTREAVLATLAFVASRPAGSGITFDYMVPPRHLPWFRRIGFYFLARRLAAIGEPWTTWLEPDVLAGDLRSMGFTSLEDLGGPALNRSLFGGKEKRVGGTSVARVVTAWNRREAWLVHVR